MTAGTISASDPHGGQPILMAGESLETAVAAMVMLHGRGAGADDILPLAHEVGAPGFAYLVPQAAGHTWYPFSFLMPVEKNEPYLTSALRSVERVLAIVYEAGIPPSKTVLLGFSQGACLASEFAARNARQYGGLIVFSGGLIGADGTLRDHQGSFDGTPVFVGCSDIDPHVPEARLRETSDVLRRLGADVDLRIYPGMAHTINRDELHAAKAMVSAIASPVTPAMEHTE